MGSVLSIVLIVSGLLLGASLLRGALDPSPQTSGGTTGSGGTGSQTTTTGIAYANEDYTPPPADMNPPSLPGPRNLDAAHQLVAENPVYEGAVAAPTNCTMGPLDMANSSRAAMQTHLNELVECLMRVYEEPVTRAGFELPRPPVTVYDRPITTACGDFEQVNAAYCGGDQRIYYARPLLGALPGQASATHYAAETILAHEFGHAVQARTAILVSEGVLEQQARTDAASLDLSRRLEVQADCFAGLYVASVARSQNLGSARVAALGKLMYTLGDDVLSGQPGQSEGHGTGAARRAWFQRGVASTDVGTCNTFTADADAVR